MNEIIHEADRLEADGHPLGLLLRWHRQSIEGNEPPYILQTKRIEPTVLGDGYGGGNYDGWGPQPSPQWFSFYNVRADEFVDGDGYGWSKYHTAGVTSGSGDGTGTGTGSQGRGPA